MSNERWESDYESSTDGEEIILPSRNASFTIPPPKGPKLARFDTTRGENRRHSASGIGYSQSESSSQQSMAVDSVESEAETVMDDLDGSGDATRALRKVMESRRKGQMKPPQHHRYASGGTIRGSVYSNYSSTNISPTTVTDPDALTPSSSRSGTTRCVCNNGDSEGFMIQW